MQLSSKYSVEKNIYFLTYSLVNTQFLALDYFQKVYIKSIYAIFIHYFY